MFGTLFLSDDRLRRNADENDDYAHKARRTQLLAEDKEGKHRRAHGAGALQQRHSPGRDGLEGFVVAFLLASPSDTASQAWRPGRPKSQRP